MSPSLPPEPLCLEVASEGRIPLPLSVRESLRLAPGDLLTLTCNAGSVRLDPYKDLLEDLQRSWNEPNGRRYLERFLLSRTLAAIGSGGSVALPPEILELHPGDRISLEIETEGPRHALYVYRAHG